MCNCTSNNEKIAEIQKYIDKFQDKRGNLISILRKAQDLFGYISPNLQEYLSQKTGLSKAEIYGVVTFYNYFSITPKGKYNIMICMGTACYVNGSEKILEELKRKLNINIKETTSDGKYYLETVRCIGACAAGPAMVINNKIYSRLKIEDLNNILAQFS